MLKDKILLVTGGTGSFGSTVVDKLLHLSPDIQEIRVFSRDEKKQDDMRRKINNEKVKYYIGDVREKDSVLQVMRNVDFVFHAAALKQVPSCEFYPIEAIRTNILGAENVLDAALQCRAKKVVVLSTDKAVYPINVMGMSKAMMEKLMIAKARMTGEGGTVFCATRYGNVMASRGSVIPLFIEQIKKNRPLTITDENMTRFLMSLDDSVDLVLHAFKNAKQGDIFVQKSPASTVGVLAQAISELLDSNTGIECIGTRHGEKLFESLLSREEMAKAESSERYYRVPMDARDLNYNVYFSEGSIQSSNCEEYTSHNTERLDVEQVKQLLLSLACIRDALYA